MNRERNNLDKKVFLFRKVRYNGTQKDVIIYVEDMDYQLNAIRKMADHERVVARLYDTFATMFPEQSEYWSTVASEELRHAAWVSELAHLIEHGTITFAQDRFPLGQIDESIKYVEQLIHRANHDQVGLNESFEEALGLERRMLEHGFLDVLDSDSQKLKEVLIRLREETQSHVDQMQQKWEQIQQELGAMQKIGDYAELPEDSKRE